MDLNQEGLQERFQWEGGDFREAKALIAGTEHPLNDSVGPKSQNNLESYDGKSSKELLKEQLQALPAERRAELVEDIQLLRFADQSAEYLHGKEAALESVRGLSREVKLPEDVLIGGTPNFVKQLGSDNEAFGDLPQKMLNSLKKELAIDAPVYTAEKLHGFLSDEQIGKLKSIKNGLS